MRLRQKFIFYFVAAAMHNVVTIIIYIFAAKISRVTYPAYRRRWRCTRRCEISPICISCGDTASLTASPDKNFVTNFSLGSVREMHLSGETRRLLWRCCISHCISQRDAASLITSLSEMRDIFYIYFEVRVPPKDAHMIYLEVRVRQKAYTLVQRLFRRCRVSPGRCISLTLAGLKFIGKL
jgi:hypothetical protein